MQSLLMDENPHFGSEFGRSYIAHPAADEARERKPAALPFLKASSSLSRYMISEDTVIILYVFLTRCPPSCLSGTRIMIEEACIILTQVAAQALIEALGLSFTSPQDAGGKLGRSKHCHPNGYRHVIQKGSDQLSYGLQLLLSNLEEARRESLRVGLVAKPFATAGGATDLAGQLNRCGRAYNPPLSVSGWIWSV